MERYGALIQPNRGAVFRFSDEPELKRKGYLGAGVYHPVRSPDFENFFSKFGYKMVPFEIIPVLKFRGIFDQF